MVRESRDRRAIGELGTDRCTLSIIRPYPSVASINTREYSVNQFGCVSFDRFDGGNIGKLTSGVRILGRLSECGDDDDDVCVESDG